MRATRRSLPHPTRRRRRISNPLLDVRPARRPPTRPTRVHAHRPRTRPLVIAILSTNHFSLMNGKALTPIIITVAILGFLIMGGAAVLKRRSVAYDATMPGLY